MFLNANGPPVAVHSIALAGQVCSMASPWGFLHWYQSGGFLKLAKQRPHGRMDGWTDGRAGVRADGQMDRRTDGWTDRPTDVQLCTGAQMDTQLEERVDGHRRMNE